MRKPSNVIHKRLGLDYLVLDCSETPDGRLFIFEADTIMIVHSMDRDDIYPYKRPAMMKIFNCFSVLPFQHARPRRYRRACLMFRTFVKSKIHRARVTGADLNYVGSISICPESDERPPACSNMNSCT